MASLPQRVIRRLKLDDVVASPIFSSIDQEFTGCVPGGELCVRFEEIKGDR